jgi:hypothetical protein
MSAFYFNWIQLIFNFVMDWIPHCIEHTANYIILYKKRWAMTPTFYISYKVLLFPSNQNKILGGGISSNYFYIGNRLLLVG